ncbi:MAG: class I SAM-dependent methyltransferase [bacterium]|nr:class I SAM-dependent methyltransferase [bacterium]
MMCYICQSLKVKKLFDFDAAASYLCGECRAVYSNARVNTYELYDRKYFVDNYESIRTQQFKKSEKIIKWIKQYKEKGSLLDYGCGSGIFLKAAVENGYNKCAGADVSSDALAAAGKNLEDKHIDLIHLKTNNTDKCGQLKNKFDIITFVDSIAHIPDVRDVFSNLIQYSLHQKGIVYIRTPNINFWYILYARALSLLLPKKHIKLLFFIPKRCILFNKLAMKKFLSSFGLSITAVYFERDYIRRSDNLSLKQKIGSFVFQDISRYLNPNRSMSIIAKRNDAG